MHVRTGYARNTQRFEGFAYFASTIMIHWKNNLRPEPPYYANIFHYYYGDDLTGYTQMDDFTMELVHEIDGFLGYESHKSEGRGSFISYWKDMESIELWRRNTIHQQAKQEGKRRWYKYYHSMLVKVESAHFHGE